MASSSGYHAAAPPPARSQSWRTPKDHGLACARAGDWVEAATLLEAAAKALEAIVYNEKRYLEPEADQELQYVSTLYLNIGACCRQLRQLEALSRAVVKAQQSLTLLVLPIEQCGQVALARLECQVLQPSFGQACALQLLEVDLNLKRPPGLHREWVAAANASSEAYGRELPPQIAVVEEAAMEIQANLGAIKEGAQNGCISEADVTALLGWDLQAISAVEGSVTEALAFVLACACAHSVGAARRVSQAAAQQRDKVVSDLKKGAGDATLRPALRLLEAMGGSLAPTIRGMHDARDLPMLASGYSPSSPEQGPAHTPFGALTVAAAYRHPFVVSAMLGCNWHHTSAGKAMALMAAGHLPPFLLTEAFAGNSQPGWLPELAMLGGLILKGALSLQEHKRHVQGYFEKATQVAVRHLMRGLYLPNTGESEVMAKGMLDAQLGAALCAGVPEGNKVHTLLSHLLPGYGSSATMLAPGGDVPAETAKSLQQLLGTRDALQSLREDWDELLLGASPEIAARGGKDSEDCRVDVETMAWELLDVHYCSLEDVWVIDPMGTGAFTSLEAVSKHLHQHEQEVQAWSLKKMQAMFEASQQKQRAATQNGGQDHGSGSEDETGSISGEEVLEKAQLAFIILMDGGDPPFFNLGPRTNPAEASTGEEAATAARQEGVVRQRAELMSSFREPHMLYTPLEKTVPQVVRDEGGGLVVIGLSRRDPVPSTTTWAAGGAWPTAAVEVEVRGEAAAHSAFYVDGGDLVLSGLDVRAPGSRASRNSAHGCGHGCQRQDRSSIPCLVRALATRPLIRVTASRFSAAHGGMCIGLAGQVVATIDACSFQGGLYGLSYGSLLPDLRMDERLAVQPELYSYGCSFEGHARYGLQAAGPDVEAEVAQCVFQGCMEGALCIDGAKGRRAEVHMACVVADRCGGQATTGSAYQGHLERDALGAAITSLAAASTGADPADRAELMAKGAAAAQQVLTCKGAVVLEGIDSIKMSDVLVTRSESSGILLLGCPMAILRSVMVTDCCHYGLVASFTSDERALWATVRLPYEYVLPLESPSADVCELDLDGCVLLGNGQAGLWVTDVCAKVSLECSAIDVLQGPAKGSGGTSSLGKFLDSVKKGEMEEEVIDPALGPMARNQWLSRVDRARKPYEVADFLDYGNEGAGSRGPSRRSSSSRVARVFAALGGKAKSKVYANGLVKGGGKPAAELALEGTYVQLDHLPVTLKADCLQGLVFAQRQRQAQDNKKRF